MDDTRFRYEARVSHDGRITWLSELAAGGQRPVPPHSREGIAILSQGNGVVYRFADGAEVRDLPYLHLLQAIRQDILLTACKARHGELIDEPEVLPALSRLLAAIADAADAFRRACHARGRQPVDT